MEKTHKIALLSLASCFAVAATLSTYSAKLCRNIEASAENVYETTTQVIPLDVSSFGFSDGETLSIAYTPLCFQFSPLTREFILGEYHDFNVGKSYFISYLDVGNPYFTEFLTYYRDSGISFNSFATSVTVNLLTTSYPYIDEYSYHLYCVEQNYTYNVDYTFYANSVPVLTLDFRYDLWDTGWIYTFDMSTMQTDDSDGFSDDRLSVGNLPFYPYFSYEVAYNDGYTLGRKNGYNDGYADGINNAVDGDGLSWNKLFTSMINVPINAIRELFDFNILGYNISSFLFSILTIAVVLTIINLIL